MGLRLTAGQCTCGGIGRRSGFKLRCPWGVRVQVSPGARFDEIGKEILWTNQYYAVIRHPAKEQTVPVGMPEQEETMFIMPAIDMVATGKNIARLRQDAGLSVRDLQTFFGFATPQAIYKWQHGTAMPTIDNLVALAMIFGVSMDDIIVVDTDARAQISA